MGWEQQDGNGMDYKAPPGLPSEEELIKLTMTPDQLYGGLSDNAAMLIFRDSEKDETRVIVMSDNMLEAVIKMLTMAREAKKQIVAGAKPEDVDVQGIMAQQGVNVQPKDPSRN